MEKTIGIVKAKAIVLILIASLACSAAFAWEQTDRNMKLAETIESSLKMEAMLFVCSEEDLAEALKSALFLLTDHYVEVKEVSRIDLNEMLMHIQADVDDLFSRIEILLNDEECSNLVRGAQLRIASYTETTIHNNLINQ